MKNKTKIFSKLLLAGSALTASITSAYADKYDFSNVVVFSDSFFSTADTSAGLLAAKYGRTLVDGQNSFYTNAEGLAQRIIDYKNSGGSFSSNAIYVIGTITNDTLEVYDIENTPEESEPLTKRENEVLKELCEGYSIKTISKTLNISVTTLRVHIRSIYRKLEVNNQRQLMKKAKDKNLF